MMILDELLLFPFAAGIFFIFSAAPLGCFMVWRRLSFAGDMISHASLSGVVLAIAFNMPPFIGILLIALLMALFLITHTSKGLLSRDTYLALLSHGTLGVGLFFLSYFPGASTLISRALLGDILATEASDLWILGSLSGVVILFFMAFWRPLLSLTIHEDLAIIEGAPTKRLNLFFMGLLSLSIAIATQYLGVLLVTALLIIPAATARYFSTTPLEMILKTFFTGITGLVLGFWIAHHFDTATAPSLVAANILLFIFGIIIHSFKKVI